MNFIYPLKVYHIINLRLDQSLSKGMKHSTGECITAPIDVSESRQLEGSI